MQQKSLESLLNLAIAREEAAYAFYTELRERIADREARDTLEFLAGEERKHRDFLVKYKAGKIAAGTMQMTEVIDYKIAEHLEMPDPEKDRDSKEVYLIAAHRELAAYNFYNDLAKLHPDGEVKEMLLKMANQELKHKEKVEYLYANTAFPQTAGG
ncbi:MAG TPA: hypothetical protein ENO00_01820 [Deltaproteobacteria bacterium]|nr:hypothetical protein [Deltaproteobacteria bacterium]